MAIPTQPTATTISTEALKLFGKSSPTTAEITRATDYGIEIVKNDLKDMGLEWDFLRTTGYLITTPNIQHVQLPTDYAKYISARILDGLRGTASAGGATSITLATGASATVGQYIVITGGTGSGQVRQITAFNSSTLVATVQTWDTNPDNTSTYLIVSSHDELSMANLYDASTYVKYPGMTRKPTGGYIKSDSAEGDLYFNKTPDVIYVIELEYYADILKIDLSSTLYSRILRLLNGLLIQGVFVWLLQDDARAVMERQIYEKKKAQVAALYLYPQNLSDFSMRVDYE